MRVLRLTFTSHSMRPWAKDLGFDGEPFVWDDEERAVLKAELDAAIALLYGLNEGELRHVFENTPTLRRKEEKEFGRFVTAERVLAKFQEFSDVR